MIVRRARRQDAAAIGAVHVAAWRSAYAGILPAEYLTGLSAIRIGRRYEHAILAAGMVLVAVPEASGAPRLVGFTTASAPQLVGSDKPLGDGEIETLYVLDDWRDQGVGRALIREAARGLAAQGCRSAYVWVLSDNPSRFFYQHLGGELSAQGETRVAGVALAQMAYCWDPIDKLLEAASA